MLLIPPLGTAIWLLVSYLNDPGCQNCGEDDWQAIAGYTVILLVAPAVFGLACGVLARRALTGSRQGAGRAWG
jgi:hypothetical protein